MKSKDEIAQIKKGNKIPEKVLNEGDSLKIKAKIHSFYWKRDLLKKNDYEPVAVSERDECCLSRLHYHGIVVWQDFITKGGKPIVNFIPGFHTPTLCTNQKIRYLEPDDDLGRMILHGYFIPIVQLFQQFQNDKNYEVSGYSDLMVEEEVPEKSKFTWDDITYYVIVASKRRIQDLNINDTLKKKLIAISQDGRATTL